MIIFFGFKNVNSVLLTSLFILGFLFDSPTFSDDNNEMKVKREEVFEFEQKPKVTRSGDMVVITFASKAYCDATVAIEDLRGKIIRHLASGVLGDNAPDNFQKSSLTQRLVWDGKDDQGKLIDNKNDLVIRVSLGLKPSFEKNLYWSPYKRISQAAPLIQACEEGVLVCESMGVDSVKLFDHDGKYKRTIYPFPSNKLEGIKSLDWRDFPQGMRLPWKQSAYQQTLLTSGDNSPWAAGNTRNGRGATGMTVLNDRIALGYFKLNRLNIDGSSENLLGGKTSINIPNKKAMTGITEIGPTSLAISPDKKWVYLAGYSYRFANFETLNGVMRIPLDEPGDASLFVGNLGSKDSRALGEGTEPGQFKNASSVDCDAEGRIYVSDFMNDRIQVFSSDGKFLKEIKTQKPALVRVNRLNGEIYVFSWPIPSISIQIASKSGIKYQPSYARFSSFNDPKEISRMNLPIPEFTGWYSTYTGIGHPLWFTADIDVWASIPTIWLGRDCNNNIEMGVAEGDGGQAVPWASAGIRLLREKNGKLEVVKDFGKETVNEVLRAKPPTNAIQHLYINPENGKVYLAEADSAPTTKATRQFLEIDPESTAIKAIDLPFNPIDCAFDLNGYAYLRSTDKIMRFDPKNWKEIPFDYGMEFNEVGNEGGANGRSAPAISAILLPSKSPVCYHQGGINVSPKGHIIASCAYLFEGISGAGGPKGSNMQSIGKGYQPVLYPGRVSGSTSPCIHVWDKYGKILYQDVVPGVTQVDGVAMDSNDNIYFMNTANRIINGKPYFNPMSETLMKVKPEKCKILASQSSIPLPVSEQPKTPPHLKSFSGGNMWVQSAEWFYPGVGYAGFSASQTGGGCACWFPRFALDLYGRSVVPEPQQFSVGVLDTAGNLILRIGKYGNVDNTGPNGKIPLGGDEVGLFHPLYVGTHTDRRVFISDYGNGRLVSVKLDYHVNEKIALKDIPDSQK